MVGALGNVPADLLNVSFMMASPFVLNIGKYADLVDILDNKEALLNFLRMEKWLFGGPAASGETYRFFVKNYLQDNKLVKGEIEIGRAKSRSCQCHHARAEHLRKERPFGAATLHGRSQETRWQQGLHGAGNGSTRSWKWIPAISVFTPVAHPRRFLLRVSANGCGNGQTERHAPLAEAQCEFPFLARKGGVETTQLLQEG